MLIKKYALPIIIIGAFVVLFSAPFWLNAFSPSYEYPAVALPEGPGMEQCVEDAEWMRANHMNLLISWRDQVLREGNRYYVASDGKVWEASLQNTCMSCHSNKAAFCDTCHDTNSVNPYCWDCHVIPQGNNYEF